MGTGIFRYSKIPPLLFHGLFFLFCFSVTVERPSYFGKYGRPFYKFSLRTLF